MRIEFDVTNLNAVLDSIDDIGNGQRMRSALGKACALLEREARQKAPKDTGALRRYITSKLVTDNGDLEGIVYTPLEYAPYVDYGTGLFAESGGRTDVPWSYQDDEGNWHTTSGQKPQPFMRPAFDENREEVIRILKEGLVND